MPWKVNPKNCPGCDQEMSYIEVVTSLGFFGFSGVRFRAPSPKPGTTKRVELTCDKNETHEYTVTYV